MKTKIVELQGLVLPTNSTLKRRHVRKKSKQTQHYMERYDRHTLVYDCFYDDIKKQYVITAPRMLNFWPFFKKHLYVNGAIYKGRIKRDTQQVYEQLFIKGDPGWVFEIRNPEFSARLPVRSSVQHLFDGQNTAFAMNKNNELEWVRQWAQYHVNAHGLEGVVIIDNGSTNYPAEDLMQTLKSVTGLKTAVVVQANFPYGPVDANGKAILIPRFLQRSMFNLVKKDMFRKARAVLSVDIDELVVSDSGETVFEAAKNSKLGAVSFREQKTYPSSPDEKAYPQNAHARVVPGQKPGNTKWCVSTAGFLNHFSWAVHRFGGLLFPITETKKFRYLHCQATSTSWKKDRYKQPDNLENSKPVQTILNRFLSSIES